MEKILNKIREIRKVKGYSHENMAHELNISQAAYTKIENGETKLSIDRLYKIADILKVSVIEVLDINPNTIFNQENKDNAVGQVVNQYNESKDAYLRLIDNLKEEISFLRSLIKKQ